MATVTYIKETRQHPSAMVSVMRYCLQESKTVDQITGQRYVSGIGCDGLNSITEFLATKYAYGKLDGINFYQYVQSFSPRENITCEQAHNIAREFAMKAWPGHEVQVTTHCDAKHIHSHFVINSVSFVDGRKLRQDPNTLKQLRAISDELCREHGLSVLPPYEKGGKRMGSREYRIAAKGKSWKFRLMYDVTQAMKVSRTKDDFIREMKRRGYEVKWTDERKNITFTCPNGMKCRDSRLHQEKYRKEHIEHMRTDGEITKEEFLALRQKLDAELQKLTAEYEKLTQDAEDMDVDQPQWSRIQETLEQILDLSQPKPSPDLIRKFVSRIVPDGKSNFRWYLNLDGSGTAVQDMTVEGRKNNAVVTICAGEHDAPPEPIAIIDLQNTSILATPHRLLSKVEGGSLSFELPLGFKEAEAYRKANGQYLRKNQWRDTTVTVYIDLD